LNGTSKEYDSSSQNNLQLSYVPLIETIHDCTTF